MCIIERRRYHGCKSIAQLQQSSSGLYHIQCALLHFCSQSPPLNLKRWTVPSERLFNSHHLADHFSWPMRNNHLLLRSSQFLRSELPGHCESVHSYHPKEEDSECFSSSKMYCKGQCTAAAAAAVGQALKDHKCEPI